MTVRHLIVSTAVLLSMGVAAAACGPSGVAASGSASTTASTISPGRSTASGSTSADTDFYLDLATADPSLSSYVNGRSDVALRALLSDGVAFCDFLDRGAGIDDAMMSVAAGADRVESETHLPRSVRTFNSIDSAALLTLCPSDQKKLPAPDQASLRRLAEALAASRS